MAQTRPVDERKRPMRPIDGAAPREWMVRKLAESVKPGDRILDIGSGRDPWVEYALSRECDDFVCDRVDIADANIEPELLGRPDVGSIAHLFGECWGGNPVEAMHDVPSDAYQVAFASWVLEHVQDVRAAAFEIRRVLAPRGIFVATIPNPAAPHMWMAGRTPPGLRRRLLGMESWETVYGFRSPGHLASIFKRVGFSVMSLDRFGNLAAYLRWPGLRQLGAAYDMAGYHVWNRLLGAAVITMRRDRW